MNESSEYNVKFGSSARTIEYEDPGGKTWFSLDGSPKGTNWITLEHHSPLAPRPPFYGVAFDRVKHYLESRGFQVEVYGSAEQDKNAFGPEMETLLYEDSQGKLILFFQVDTPDDGSSRKPVFHFVRGGSFTKDGEIRKCETQEDQQRLAAALEKGKQFLVSQGYQV